MIRLRMRAERRLLELDEVPDLRALADYGFGTEVGERAGLSRSSVYQYFKSRDDLLEALRAVLIQSLNPVQPGWEGEAAVSG